MANFAVLIQFLAVDDKYLPSTETQPILVDWVEDVIFQITKMPDPSWKQQLDKTTNWLWFQCIRQLSNLLSSYFYFVLDPEVHAAAAKDRRER